VEVSPFCDEEPMGSNVVSDHGRQDEEPHEAVSNERFDRLCNLRSQLRGYCGNWIMNVGQVGVAAV
jgi:hypothetical protein